VNKRARRGIACRYRRHSAKKLFNGGRRRKQGIRDKMCPSFRVFLMLRCICRQERRISKKWGKRGLERRRSFRLPVMDPEIGSKSAVVTQGLMGWGRTRGSGDVCV
jgi:hypothetical protein